MADTAQAPVQHFVAGGYKCTCGFDALSATQYGFKRGYDYARELNRHFDFVRGPAEQKRKDDLRKQFDGIKTRTDERGFTGINFVVDEVRMSVEAFEALAAAAVKNIEDEYAINYDRH